MTTENFFAGSWRRTFRQLVRSAEPNGRQLRTSLAGLGLAAMLQGCALASLFPLMHTLLDLNDGRAAVGWFTIMTVLALAMAVLRWRAQGFDYNGLMTDTTHFLRLRIGEKLRSMPLEQLQKRRTGEINATLLSNVDEQLHYTLTIVDLLFISLVTPLTVAVVAMAIDWRIGVLLLLSFPAVFLLHRRLRPLHHSNRRRLNAENRKNSADIFEYVQGLAELRVARAHAIRSDAVRTGFQRLEKLQRECQREAAKPNILSAGLMEISLLGVAAACIYWVWQGTMPSGFLVAAVIVMARFAEPLSLFVTYTVVFEMIEAALESIDHIMQTQPLPQAPMTSAPHTWDVRFERVTFRYLGAPDHALEGVDVVIPARSMTALVGPSGSGKSSLLRLLMRHADPQQGRILIGGADIRAMSAEQLNSMVAAVFQEVSLFDDTIANNIRIGRADASDTQLREAARAAQCLDFIERLPQGFDTPLGELGGRLSGGQRQRISIARALLKDAPIVVLDEPTAALDVDSEVAVQHAISALVCDKTVIVVAHRLSTIVGADQILVMERGCIVQRGTHRQLSRQDGRYRKMWEAQGQVKRWRV